MWDMANQDLMRTNIQTPSNDSIHKGSLDTCQLKTCIYMYDSGEEILFCDLNRSTPSLCIRISIFHDKARRAFLSQCFDSKDPNSLWTCKRSLILPASTSSATRFGMLPRCQRIFSTNLDILALLILAHRTSDDEIGPFNARYWMVCIGSFKGCLILATPLRQASQRCALIGSGSRHNPSNLEHPTWSTWSHYSHSHDFSTIENGWFMVQKSS